MSDLPNQSFIPSPRERLAGKWQIPALLIALAGLVGVATQIESPERKLGIDKHLEQIARQLDAGMQDAVLARIERLLAWEDLQKEHRLTLLLQRARARQDRAERRGDLSSAVSEEVLKDYAAVIDGHVALTERDHARMARCLERLGQYAAAVVSYDRAAELAPPPALDYRRKLIELSEYPLQVSDEEFAKLLEGYLTAADSVDNLPELTWALARRVEMLSQCGDSERADALLERYRERLADSSEAASYAYLLALADYGAGRFDEAERRLRALLNDSSPVGPVFARAGWLLGKVVANDGQAQRPEEAIAIFREVIASHADPTYVAASRVGMAEALAAVERFEEAREAYKQAINDQRRLRHSHLVNPDRIRVSLTAVGEEALAQNALARAAEFFALALDLVPAGDPELEARHRQLLANTQAQRARALRGEAAELRAATTNGFSAEADALDSEARRLLGEAGDDYMRIAWLTTLNETRASDAMWTAANLFDEGGHEQRAINLLQAFVRDRPDSEIIPRVLMRLGKALQRAGRYEEAVEAFRRNVSTYPRSPFALRSLVPLAECFMAQGGAADVEAENALRQILDNSVLFTPEAPEYCDAMFLLGELYCRQGRYEEALPVLEETLANYPSDPRLSRAMFLAANAYRLSAMAVKEDLRKPELVGESKRLRAEFARRLQEAGRRFRLLTERLEQRREEELSDLDRLYLQDARLYEAACLFEQERYADALALYERAAWIYKDSPVALGAYVQVINCYIFLGRREEAETALRRAQYLVEAIADERFTASGGSQSRADWRRYFNWVGDIIRDQQTG
jgi:tetratricopeptide (TPR) repeat protein